MRLADLLPDPEEVGLLLREDDDAVVVLEALQQDLDLLALHRRVLELVERDRALALEAELQDDGGVGDAQDRRVDDLALPEGLEAAAELLQQRLELLLRGREDLLAVRVVEELGGNPLGHVRDGHGGFRLDGRGFGGGLLGAEGGDLACHRVDDDLLAFGELGVGGLWSVCRDVRDLGVGFGILRIGHDRSSLRAECA